MPKLCRIIRVGDSIINDPNASASEKQWAQGKRDGAIQGQQANGGIPTNIS
jgi:hypothetical protein